MYTSTSKRDTETPPQFTVGLSCRFGWSLMAPVRCNLSLVFFSPSLALSSSLVIDAAFGKLFFNSDFENDSATRACLRPISYTKLLYDFVILHAVAQLTSVAVNAYYNYNSAYCNYKSSWPRLHGRDVCVVTQL